MTMSDTSEPHTHNQPDTSEPLGLLSTVNSRRQKPIVRTIQQLHSELGSCYIPIIREADISQMLLPNIAQPLLSLSVSLGDFSLARDCKIFHFSSCICVT